MKALLLALAAVVVIFLVCAIALSIAFLASEEKP